jgi:hypothetical protein
VAKPRMYVPPYERENMARAIHRLGFSSYGAYINSGLWATARRRLMRRSCEACKAESGLVLHHMTYARLGAESIEDVCTLCRRCHGAAHYAAQRGGTLYPAIVMAARSGRPAREKRISALEVSCPLCGAMPENHCRLPSGRIRPQEHKERRQALDRQRKQRSSARRRRQAKKQSQSVRMPVRRYEAISSARDAEFPLQAMRAELDAQLDQAIRLD